MAKVGRNEPCPCGSGKKYKKCCFGQPLYIRTLNEAKATQRKGRSGRQQMMVALACMLGAMGFGGRRR